MTDSDDDKGIRWDCIEWRGLYGEGWGVEIVPEAFAHPAKYSRALIRRIYQEMLDRGWLTEGDTVIDCFGGVALGGLDAMLAGLHWQGCELEPRFVALGQANIDLWNKRYAAQMPHWGTARIAQGDSRKLRSVLIAAEASVSNPPFGGSELSTDERLRANMKNPGRNWSTDAYGDANLANLPVTTDGLAGSITSPPFLQTSGGTNVTSDSGPLSDARLIDRHAAGNAAAEAYGADSGNLGNMPEGQPGYTAALSSHPFADQIAQQDRAFTMPHDTTGRINVGYGDTDGQLGAMPQGDATVSSPPYESNDQRGGHTAVAAEKHVATHGYGDTPGNVGNDTGDTFWTAARAIVAETFAVLRPGAHAAWVLKRFVRNGAIVEFPDQWRQLCESIGLKTVLWVHAMVVEDNGTQLAIDGNHKTHKVSRKSFFRRLHEKKHPGTEIDWEDVIFMVKPATFPLFASINGNGAEIGE